MFTGWSSLALAATSHKPAPKKSHSSTATGKSASSKTRQAASTTRGRTKAASSRSSKGSRGKSSKQQASRRSQQAPTAERYAEIQSALAAKGVFQGQPTGTWGPDSVQALKEFQRGQNLPVTGKIDSLSLIALGLGPQRTANARTNPESNQARPQ